MDRAIISINNGESEKLIKEAKKKAIDCGITFSDAALSLIKKWVSGDISLEDKESK